MVYTMADAKRDFERGILRSYELNNQLFMGENYWCVLFKTSLPGIDSDGALVDARSKEVRQFKSLDAAVNALRQIGFQVGSLSGQ